MLHRPTNILAAGAVALALGAATFAAHAQDGQNYILATASTGGTYYPVGVAIATLTKVKLEPTAKIGMSAISSAGSGENVKLMRDNEAQFAILQGLFGFYAATGTGPVAAEGPQEHLRSVSMLWQNVEHFVIASDRAGTGTIADFVAAKGEAMALGAQNSGTIESNAVLLEPFGVDIENDYELFYGGYGPSVAAMQDGKVVGIGAPAGVPVGAITQLMSAIPGGATLLSFTDEQVAQADDGRNLWTPFTIPAGTYPGQDQDIQTIAQPNFLAVREDVDEESVYQITKTIYENLPFLNAIHAATSVMNIDAAIAGLPLPLHPGAARYYNEVGIDIPERLMASQ